MWKKALVLGLVLMAIGMVVGGVAVEKAEIGLVLAKDHLVDRGAKAAGAGSALATAGGVVYGMVKTGLVAKFALGCAVAGLGVAAIGVGVVL
ncbi:hypothetical protein A3L04_01520 [Thermococcus chitonophagus]|uniref:Pilin n=1 Tax=Thermococcus chitonophagus TaxID=54262 RepID=A0A160VTZ1_9EURY|nr:hypothetical protein [Thermococcus chitonophagus]ASJ15844.1 hypothetical protein A3L04_01520 [Thermococcus chitonophagus]CUX77081.1 hypothetical protein CHITON_0302 [Thermococcus chitonophagus]